jgi:thiol-disulfide isomerase/thioredoxin
MHLKRQSVNFIDCLPLFCIDAYICYMTSKPGNKLFTFNNVLNIVYIGAILLLLFNPAAKALLIRALMNVGFFQPDISLVAKSSSIQRLPSVTLADKEGKTWQLADLRGKVVFVNFWATWCPPCLAEMPGINQLYSRFKGNPNVVFVMVDVDQQLTKSSAFLKKHDWNLPLYQAIGTIPQALSSESIPFTVIFDRRGKIVYRREGTADYSRSKMVEFIKMLSR